MGRKMMKSFCQYQAVQGNSNPSFICISGFGLRLLICKLHVPSENTSNANKSFELFTIIFLRIELNFTIVLSPMSVLSTDFKSYNCR